MSADAANHPSGHLIDEHGRDHVTPADIALGVIIGRTSEYFDFFVFGLGCVLVFPELVFPFADRLTGTLYAFGIFALAADLYLILLADAQRQQPHNAVAGG